MIKLSFVYLSIHLDTDGMMLYFILIIRGSLVQTERRTPLYFLKYLNCLFLSTWPIDIFKIVAFPGNIYLLMLGRKLVCYRVS